MATEAQRYSHYWREGLLPFQHLQAYCSHVPPSLSLGTYLKHFESRCHLAVAVLSESITIVPTEEESRGLPFTLPPTRVLQV